MHVETIADIDSLGALRRDWDAVYGADPDAHFFLSWTWMSTWLEEFREGWFVLAAKQSARASSFDAFFPLAISAGMRAETGFFNVVSMAGNRHADYTGFLCRPEIEARAVNAFADRLRQMNWATLRLEQVRISDDRMRRLLSCFPERDFTVKPKAYVQDGIDNLVCPFVRLPGDWETYRSRLSANTREKLRRSSKLLAGSGEMRITHADRDTVERHVDVLLRLWQEQWGQRKRDRLSGILTRSRTMMLSAAAEDALFLPILWHRDKPVGALAFYVDQDKKSLLFFMAGRDAAVTNPPPGFVLHMHSIRYAIEHGIEVYDLMRGDEPYKKAFGADERRISNIVVSTRTGRNLGDKLDARSVPEVLRRIADLHKAKRLPQAARGYRQVLAVAPGSQPALYGYGQILADKGDHAGAAELFDRLVRIEPRAKKAWLRLAHSLEAAGRVNRAAWAFDEATRLDLGQRRPAGALNLS